MQRHSKVEKRHPRLRLTETEQWPGNQRTAIIIEPGPMNCHEDRGEEKREKTKPQEPLLIPSQITSTRQIESHISDANHNQCRSAPEQCVVSRRWIHHYDSAENPRQREKRGEQWN